MYCVMMPSIDCWIAWENKIKLRESLGLAQPETSSHFSTRFYLPFDLVHSQLQWFLTLYGTKNDHLCHAKTDLWNKWNR